MWREGKFVIDGVELLYEAKVYDERSLFGINGGRISKLQVVKGSYTWDNTIINYDRGWDIKPKDDLSRKALNYILNLYK